MFSIQLHFIRAKAYETVFDSVLAQVIVSQTMQLGKASDYINLLDPVAS